MPETKKEQLRGILQNLRKTEDIQSSSVISKEGMLLSSDVLKKIDKEIFAAMSAAIQGAAETAVTELKQGSLNQIIINAERGKLIIINAGEKAILVVLVKNDVNLGLMLREMGKAGRNISKIIEGNGK